MIFQVQEKPLAGTGAGTGATGAAGATGATGATGAAGAAGAAARDLFLVDPRRCRR